jgi:Cys-rich protein (TIGR01571 family)
MGSFNGTGRINPCSFQFWFAMMVVILVLSFASNIVQVSVGSWEDTVTYENGEAEPGPYEYVGPAWASTLASICSIITAVISILGCIATCKAREYLRHQYNIEPEMCGSCEDCCCAYWCGPCTLCQMARHTADYHVHKAECCSATGLYANAPEVV